MTYTSFSKQNTDGFAPIDAGEKLLSMKLRDLIEKYLHYNF